MKPDVWFRNQLVIETIATQLTLSPIHTAVMGKIRSGARISIRFSKFTGGIRDDKKSEEATTMDEVMEMYSSETRKTVEPKR